MWGIRKTNTNSGEKVTSYREKRQQNLAGNEKQTNKQEKQTNNQTKQTKSNKQAGSALQHMKEQSYKAILHYT